MIRNGLLVAALSAGAMIGATPAHASIDLAATSDIINQLHNNAMFSVKDMSFSTCENGVCTTQFTGLAGLQAYNQDLTALNNWAGTGNYASSGGFFDNYRFTFSATSSFFGNQTPQPQSRTSGPELLASPPVPEPATWAMMIMGFGLVGFAMRRRATAVSFG